MKRFIITLALACAAISASAQIIDLNPSAITFTSREPERATETVATVRLGTIAIIRTHLGYGLIAAVDNGLAMNLGETKFRATVTMDDILSLFDMQDGQARTFTIARYFEYRATKVGNNIIHIDKMTGRGRLVLTRNQCKRLIAQLKAYNPD